MASTNTPNMGLIVPGVGTEQGPLYATDINNSLSVIDTHDHTSGRGVQITPTAININAPLAFNNNFATNIAGLTLTAQISTPAVNTVYQSGNDLYFVDGVGNNVRITQSGGVAGTPGSIANLVAPASASYVAVSSNFVWQSDTLTAANMDFGAAIMRNLSPNSTYALTLQPPTLTSNYTLTLPSIPVAKRIVTIDTSGTMAADTTADNASIIISSNLITVGPKGVQTSMIADLAVGTAQIANGAITAAKFQNGVYPGAQYQVFGVGVGSFTVPAGVNAITVYGCGGGGGGGGGAGGSSAVQGAGGGGGAAYPSTITINTTPGATFAYSVGAGGSGGSGVINNQAGNGGNGAVTLFGSYQFLGGLGGGGGGQGSAGAGGGQVCVFANYGGGGGYSSNPAGLTGGAAGSSNVATAYTGRYEGVSSGGPGGPGAVGVNGGGGGGGGANGAGAAGGDNSHLSGYSGPSIGSGGGGGAGVGATIGGQGGTGGPGTLIVSWIA